MNIAICVRKIIMDTKSIAMEVGEICDYCKSIFSAI